jgi:hypothetical protein
MARPLDHSAVLLPGERRRGSAPTPLPWVRMLVIFLYVAVTGCAIVLLALSWRDELQRRHVAQASAATSLGALQTAQQKISVLEEHDRKLTESVDRLTQRLVVARHRASRRLGTVRTTIGVLRTTRDFLVALDGLDETLQDVVASDKALERAKGHLATHLNGLSSYLSATKERDLDRSRLRARTMALTRDLATIVTLVARLTTSNETLDKVVAPLGKTDELDAAVKSALARARAALRR